MEPLMRLHCLCDRKMQRRRFREFVAERWETRDCHRLSGLTEEWGCCSAKCPVIFPTYPAARPLTGACWVGMLRVSLTLLCVFEKGLGYILGILLFNHFKFKDLNLESFLRPWHVFLCRPPPPLHIHTPNRILTILASSWPSSESFKTKREEKQAWSKKKKQPTVLERLLGFVHRLYKKMDVASEADLEFSQIHQIQWSSAPQLSCIVVCHHKNNFSLPLLPGPQSNLTEIDITNCTGEGKETTPGQTKGTGWTSEKHSERIKVWSLTETCASTLHNLLHDITSCWDFCHIIGLKEQNQQQICWFVFVPSVFCCVAHRRDAAVEPGRLEDYCHWRV